MYNILCYLSLLNYLLHETIIFLLVSMFFLSFAALAVPPTDHEGDDKKSEEEGIHCVVYKDGEKVAECWLCNCGALYQAVHGKPKLEDDKEDDENGG